MNTTLPIYEIVPELKASWKGFSRFLIHAPTGSGKSTQLPQILLSEGFVPEGKIVILEPRRLAARMLARRVAHEWGCEVREEVGYRVRFDPAVSEKTRIIFETDGILVRELLDDPSLKGVSAVILDEFHERHLYGDLLLSLFLERQKQERPDLKILVMSATLDSLKLEDFLSPCKLIQSKGRFHPVEIRHKALSSGVKVWEAAAVECETLIQNSSAGDILVFMPGVYEIHKTLDQLKKRGLEKNCRLFALHGELTAREQDEAVAPCDTRKIIVSTNVAETSLTIEGVTFVVDSGLARKSVFDPVRGLNTLLLGKISRSSADQRAGRAGRTKPGVCLRLWSRDEEAFREAFDLPEIQRIDFSESLLLLKKMAVADLASFPWLDPPSQAALGHSLNLLKLLGAVDPQTEALTPLGASMLLFPLHPRLSRVLLSAAQTGVLEEAAFAAALLQEKNPFRRSDNAPLGLRESISLLQEAEQKKFDRNFCQQIGLNAASARPISKIKQTFMRIAEAQVRKSVSTGDEDAFSKSILAGFPDKLARRMVSGKKLCLLADGRKASAEESVLPASFNLGVALDIQEIGSSGKNIETKITWALPVKAEWVAELFPLQVKTQEETYWDKDQQRVKMSRRLMFNDLILEEEFKGSPSPSRAASVLADELVKKNIELPGWNEAVEEWLLRLKLFCQWCPEFGLSPVTEEDKRMLYEEICEGSYSARDLKTCEVEVHVKGWLSHSQGSFLNQHVPEHISLPCGKKAKVHYDAALPPYVAVKIQELYGLEKKLTLAQGRVPLLVHILAPNYRPVQITDDLPSFWKNRYPEVKKEMQRRYPRHLWK